MKYHGGRVWFQREADWPCVGGAGGPRLEGRQARPGPPWDTDVAAGGGGGGGAGGAPAGGGGGCPGRGDRAVGPPSPRPPGRSLTALPLPIWEAPPLDPNPPRSPRL